MSGVDIPQINHWPEEAPHVASALFQDQGQEGVIQQKKSLLKALDAGENVF